MIDRMKSFFGELYRYWMLFAHFLGEVNFTLIFSAIFFIVIGPYAIVTKLIGKKQTCGWMEKKYTRPSVEFLKRQF